MSAGRSLLSRLLIGAVIWTITITVVMHFASITLIRHFEAHMSVLHFTLLGLVATGLLLAALVLVRSGLSPLHELRARLADLRAGRARRIEGQHPTEVQPLVEDLNAMLEDRERRVAHAQAKAGDLAHGLKTPLALLALEADKLRAAGHDAPAEAIHEQIERMRGQIDHHLAQARAAAAGTLSDARCELSEAAHTLARTMLKLHAARPVAIDVRVAAPLMVRVQRQDLDEMLGNVLDNAARWAASRVVVDATSADGHVVVTVDDNGPGIAANLRESMLRRGVRADETKPGSGLGLAIVGDVAEVYGGTVELGASPLGGLRVSLRLPAAAGTTGGPST